jgi:glycerate kinase
MPHRILIIPDKFKGTLTAPAAAAAIARGWLAIRPGDSPDLLPMSDGGDGFGEVMAGLLDARAQRIATMDAAHHRSNARWWWQPQTETAILESAEVIGLAQHPGCHPYDLDSFGLGAVLRAAWRKGAKRCLIGVGGTATVDGGFGLARALGWEFLDDAGRPIPSWTRLDTLAELRPPVEKSPPAELIVAVDVTNPLLGPSGCARVYGPQKGLTEFEVADRCLGRLAAVARRQLGRDCASHPGAGAAGGLGFAFECFLGAELQPGYDLFAQTAQLRGRLRRADLVITGEGAIDHSTFMGKGVGQIMRACRELKIPCVGLAGTLKEPDAAKKKFAVARELLELASLKQARKQPALWLERLAAEVARDWRPKASDHK